ncbi:MAG: rRNA pseudouridine synthase [Deltaproteobacteria bacterium]|nr:rRNA pseudouridine synthase [Deltaproteobacteria bacterium]
MRVHKWLAQLGLTSRRQAERWIKAGRVTVNGCKVSIGDSLDPAKDSLVLDGKKLSSRKPSHVYWMLNKPDKVLTTRKKEDDRTTIYDLPALQNLSFLVNPVGRLDFHTEGLLLLTNDGDLAYRLMHPRFQMERVYLVTVARRLSSDQEQRIAEGVTLEDGVCKASLRFLKFTRQGSNGRAVYRVALREGRNRIVRRLFEHFGIPVLRLARQSFGTIRLSEDLSAGDLRPLSSAEINTLKKAVNLV